MVSPARIKTNRLLAKAFNLNDFLDPTRLAHDELQYYNDLTRAFDKIINHYINWLDSSEAKKLFYEEIQNREEYFQTIDSDLDDIIRDTSLSADRIIEKVYRKGLSYGYKDINRLPVFNDACKYGLKATQEYNFELITNVSNGLIDSIRHHIFRGIAEGQSIHEVARAITDSGLKPIEGKTLSAYQRASLIARTEIARSMTTGRLQSYANYGVEKVKILTAGDDNVCPICLEAAHVFNGEKTHENIVGERVYDLDKASDLVPFHPACRCSVIAHIEHYNDISQKPINDPNIMCCTPLKGDVQSTFDNYNDDSAKAEFGRISDKGEISYRDENGDLHEFDIICTENAIVDFPKTSLNRERCYKYEIFDNSGKLMVTILRSHERQGISIRQVLKIYDNLPKVLTKNCENIVLSSQKFKDRDSGGYVHPNFPETINILGNVGTGDMEYMVIHEIAHSFDFSNGILSNTHGRNGFISKFKEDLKNSIKNNSEHNENHIIHYVSLYSYEKTVIDINEKYPYAEDFAECIYELICNHKNFYEKFPAKETYLCKLLEINSYSE